MNITDMATRRLPRSAGQPNMSTRIEISPDIGRADQVCLAALATSVARSRRFVRQVCSSWQLDEERVDIAELLVSELSANAVQASGVAEARPAGEPSHAEPKLIGVRLLELRDSLVIEVWDTSPHPPVLLAPSEELERGRGLQLVDALSIRWGHHNARTGGKAVWCELSRDGAAGTDAADDRPRFNRSPEPRKSMPGTSRR